MFRIAALALAIVVVLLIHPALAACPEQAIPELRKGMPVTILRTDGSTMRAGFLRAGESPARLVLEDRFAHSQRVTRQLEIPIADIVRLEAPPRTRFHGKRVGIGALVGLGVGGIVGAVIPIQRGSELYLDSRSGSSFPSTASHPTTTGERVGSIFATGLSGALAGTIVGLFVSTMGGKPRSWSCEDVPPGAAAPDSL